jgi:hypothetical protein
VKLARLRIYSQHGPVLLSWLRKNARLPRAPIFHCSSESLELSRRERAMPSVLGHGQHHACAPAACGLRPRSCCRKRRQGEKVLGKIDGVEPLVAMRSSRRQITALNVPAVLGCLSALKVCVETGNRTGACIAHEGVVKYSTVQIWVSLFTVRALYHRRSPPATAAGREA